MQIRFATNDSYYSRFFRFIFKEPVSHVGLGFFMGTRDLMVDCTKPYGGVYSNCCWSKKHTTLYFLDIKMSEEDEFKAYHLAVESAVLTEYDWGAYYYGFLMGIRKFLFRTPLPPHNKWQAKEKFLCTEILQPLKKILEKNGLDIRYLDLSAFTPHMLGKNMYRKWWPKDKKHTWPMGGPSGEV